MTRAPRRARLRRFAVAASGETAARWLALLDAADIEAAVRIEDARAFGFGSRAYPGLPAESLFAHGLYVAPGQQASAARVLIDAGWDGRRIDGRMADQLPSARLVIAGALGTLALTAALVLFLLWRGV